MLSVIEYWVHRYQELIAATLTIAGVVYATRPVWKQVALMQSERTARIREAIAMDYSALEEAKALLTFDRLEDVSSHRRDDLQFAPPEYLDTLRTGYEATKKELAARRERATKLNLSSEAMAIVLGAFDEIAVDDANWSSALVGRDQIETSAAWFTYLDQPERMIAAATHRAKAALDEMQSALIPKLVKPE